MIRVLAQRLIDLMVVLWGVSALVFLMIRFIPGDAVQIMLGANVEITPERLQALYQKIGLDKPMLEQYASWIGGILVGDLGTSNICKTRRLDQQPRRADAATNSITRQCMHRARIGCVPLVFGRNALLFDEHCGAYRARTCVAFRPAAGVDAKAGVAHSACTCDKSGRSSHCANSSASCAAADAASRHSRMRVGTSWA